MTRFNSALLIIGFFFRFCCGQSNICADFSSFEADCGSVNNITIFAPNITECIDGCVDNTPALVSMKAIGGGDCVVFMNLTWSDDPDAADDGDDWTIKTRLTCIQTRDLDSRDAGEIFCTSYYSDGSFYDLFDYETLALQWESGIESGQTVSANGQWNEVWGLGSWLGECTIL